jgi:hypothetical protein
VTPLLTALGITMLVAAWLDVHTWISRDVLWLGGVIVACTAAVLWERRT